MRGGGGGLNNSNYKCSNAKFRVLGLETILKRPDERSAPTDAIGACSTAIIPHF